MTFRMRPSRVLRKMRNDEMAFCFAFKITDPTAAEIVAMHDYDCLWYDMEHSPTDLYDVESLVRAARLFDSDVIIRTPKGSYSDLIRPLEADAAGIMVPHVMSGEEAREIAWRTKFHPIGRRPLDSGNADGAYAQIPTADYIEQANLERFVIVQIEDPEALEEVDAIAAVDGIDMLLFGPGDFCHGLGITGQFDDPRVHEARVRVAQAATRHGKFAGTVGGPDNAAEYYALGYRFLNIGADVFALADYARDRLSKARGLLNGNS